MRPPRSHVPITFCSAILAVAGCSNRPEETLPGTAETARIAAPAPRPSAGDPPPAPQIRPRLYNRVVAVCIGINDYASPEIPDLNAAEPDTRAVAERFRTRYGYETVLLLGKEATLAAIDATLREYGRQLGEKDVLIVYFAGHGQVIELPSRGRAGFLIPQDARLDLDDHSDPERWADQALDMRELVSLIRGMDAHHALLIADACCSGFMTRRGAFAGRKDLHPLLAEPSRVVLAAATQDQAALENGKTGYGYFTGALLEQLERPEAASVTDLFVEVRRRVSRESKQMLPQMASVGDGDGEFVFIPLEVPEHDIRLALNGGLDHALKGVYERAMSRRAQASSPEDVYEAFEAVDYRFGAQPRERERLWQEKAERFRENALLGDILAMAGLHSCYAKGLGVEKDEGQALHWARLAHDSGQPAGKHVYGRCLLNGIGTARNEEAGWRLIEDAAGAGFPPSQSALAGRLLTDLDRTGHQDAASLARARELLERAAGAGLASAEEQLARLYLATGELPGIRRDVPRAIELLKSAAKKGLPSAQLELANVFTGNLPDAPRDLERSRQLLQEAADAGLARAQHVLGAELLQDDGIVPLLGYEQDRDRARRLFELAAGQEYSPSLMILCRMYQAGIGVPVDPRKAQEYCEKAAVLNDPHAFVVQGSWYADGRIYEQDDVKAMERFRRAATLGNPAGCRMVAWMYEQARGVPLEEGPRRELEPHYRHHAVHWYIQAARLGEDAQALRKLEEFHEEFQAQRNLGKFGIPYEEPGTPTPLAILGALRREYPESAREFEQMFGIAHEERPAAEQDRDLAHRGPAAEAAVEVGRRDDSQAVIVEGEGPTAADALRASLEEAIEQVIDDLVGAETQAQHGPAIADAVLAHCADFIDTYRQRPVSSGDGPHRIRVLAMVKRGAVLAKLREAGVPLLPLVGVGPFAEELCRQDHEQRGAALIAKVLDGYPAGCLEAEVAGRPELLGENDGQATVRLSIRYRVNVDAYAALADWLTLAFDQIAESRHEFSLTLRRNGREGYYEPQYPPDLFAARDRVNHFSFHDYLPDAARQAEFDGDKMQPVYFNREILRGDDASILDSRWSYILLPRPVADALAEAGAATPQIAVSFLGEGGTELHRVTARADDDVRPIGSMVTSFTPADPFSNGYELCILPFLSRHVFLMRPAVIQEVTATIPVEKLRQLREIKVRVG